MRTTKLGGGAFVHAVLVGIPVVLAVVAGCGSGSGGQDDEADATTSTTEPEVVDVEVEADDFKPLADMTPVREFFVDNVAGDLGRDPRGGQRPRGGAYPVGTVVQLIPTEAMVKRAPGFDPASNDWEFFTLDVSPEGTTIVDRGGSDIVSPFSGAPCELPQPDRAPVRLRVRGRPRLRPAALRRRRHRGHPAGRSAADGGLRPFAMR